MIKRCIKCGYWWTTEDGKTNVCQECGENHSIANYSESEVVEELNRNNTIQVGAITINDYVVKDGKGTLLYFGSKEDCERFIKNYETVWWNMRVEAIVK